MATRKTVNEYCSQCSLTSTLNILSSGGSVFRLHGLGSRDFKTIDRVVIAAAGRRRGLTKINGTEPYVALYSSPIQFKYGDKQSRDVVTAM